MLEPDENVGNEDLHELAGLMPCGLDEDGDMEWLGSNKQWAEYEKLREAQENQDRITTSRNELLTLAFA